MTELDAICIHPLLKKLGVSATHYFAGHNFCLYTVPTGGRDSVVDIATRYRLDGPGIELR
jgi:hypothetical protein